MSDLFIDWAKLGVDDAGAPLHVPTIMGTIIACSCRLESCQLDRALYRARVVGFIQAVELIEGRTDVASVLGEVG